MTMTTTPTSELTAKPFLSADVLRRECESLMKEKAELLAQNAAMRKALERYYQSHLEPRREQDAKAKCWCALCEDARAAAGMIGGAE